MHFSQMRLPWGHVYFAPIGTQIFLSKLANCDSITAFPRARGEIGRRAGFRVRWVTPWRFESSRAYCWLFRDRGVRIQSAQVRTTLPELPVRITSKPSLKSV